MRDLHRAAATVRVPGPADSPAAHPSGLPPRAPPQGAPPRASLLPPIPHPQEPALEPPQLLRPSAYKPRGSPFGLSYVHAALVTSLFPRASFFTAPPHIPPDLFSPFESVANVSVLGGGFSDKSPLREISTVRVPGRPGTSVVSIRFGGATRPLTVGVPGRTRKRDQAPRSSR